MFVLLVGGCSYVTVYHSEISYSQSKFHRREGYCDREKYPVDTIAVITCRDNYDLSGPSEVTCLNNESWSSYGISCDPSKTTILHYFILIQVFHINFWLNINLDNYSSVIYLLSFFVLCFWFYFVQNLVKMWQLLYLYAWVFGPYWIL